MKDRFPKLQEHHNPPRWFAKLAHFPKSFYNDPQHTRMVTPREHHLINETYKVEMPKAYTMIPRKGVIWRETGLISKESVQERIAEIREELKIK